MTEEYADIEIRVLELQERGYPVEITFSGEQEFPRGYLAPDIVAWSGKRLRGARDGGRKKGEGLFERLIADQAVRDAWAEARGQSRQRRLRLRLDAAAPELHALPWETLCDAGPEGTPCHWLRLATTDERATDELATTESEILEGLPGSIRSVAFSPDGQTLAAGNEEGQIRLWHRQGELLTGRDFLAHSDAVQALVFSPDGRRLASAGRDEVVILWHVASGLPIGRPLQGHTGQIFSLAYHPGGLALASGGSDGVRLWNLDTEAWLRAASRIANRSLTDEERKLYLGDG